jgi:phosphoribosylamine--glycine ligase
MADSKINVLLVGSGGREHALAWKLLQSPSLGKLYVAPGNAGTQDYNVPIGATDVRSLVKFAKENECLTIVGPEAPLEAGLVDALGEQGLTSFGPSKEQARLETSKSYAKQLMKSLYIPTAEFLIFKEYDSAYEYCNRKDGNVVIKFDGLASGKGVFVCADSAQAKDALRKIFMERIFGNSGICVVIEERLSGYEVSLMTICDGINAFPFGTAIDHKRLLDGDRGPNTGGMGAFSPALGFNQDQLEDVMEKIVKPVVRKTGFKGFLYAGLMMTKEGLKVLEFNARLGDPESQAIVPRLRSDLLQIVVNVSKNKLKESANMMPVWDNSYTCTVIMCSRGYPSAPELGFRIYGIENTRKLQGITIFHSGTKMADDKNLLTNGGRVLSVTAKGKDLREASDSAYNAVKLISWEGEYHRTDIGRIVSF